MLRTMLQPVSTKCCTNAAQHKRGKILVSLFLIWFDRRLRSSRRIGRRTLLLHHRRSIIERVCLTLSHAARRARVIAAGGKRQGYDQD